MKKRIVIPIAACGLALVLAAAAFISPAQEPPALTAEAPIAEQISSYAAGDAGEAEPEAADTPEEAAAPVFTLEQIRKAAFSDVPAASGQADYISYAAYCGFMDAAEEDRFAPEAFASRAELVSALWQISGQEETAYRGQFSDVSAGDPWANAVSWAVETDIAAGTEEGIFSPQSPVSRGQLAVFLHRFAAPEEEAEASLASYRDEDQVLEYARRPMAWALENRLFAGMVSDTIYPDLPVSRGQLAQALVALVAYESGEPLALSLTEKLETPRVESASRARHEDIQKKVEAVAAKYGAMGLQVAVVEDGEVTDAFACGWAVKDSVPMTPEHKIRSASITKVAVGIAAMILREEGIVSLDESIGSYWGVAARNPSYPDDPVSIRTLLSHTSSLRVFGWDTSRSYDAVRVRLQSGDSYMKAKPGSGQAWGYNNYAFGVLGQTLELASGKYLDEILDDRLWSVMGIDAAFESGSVQKTDRLATLYEGGKVFTAYKTLLKNVRPSSLGASGDNYSGGMTISAPELARMAAVLVNDGRYEGLQLLSEESVSLLESDSGIRISDGSQQALPLRFRDGLYGRDRLYYHTGSGYGVYNLLTYDPEARDAVVVLSTGAAGDKDEQNIYAVCGEITRYIYDVIR
ncbi:MAG: serine hydrolase [Oscillospiraceae bacterium]|nr:serine hydrolase [Oscillospiraceae bacterium]